MLACLPELSPETYRPHPLHHPDRVWPETNCALDLWIEVLNALGLAPEPLLSIAARQDFEGDQFGFTKIQPDDVEYVYGLRVQELSLYDSLEAHVARQMSRGRLCFVEADAYFLPDTGHASYRRRHRATMIGINRLDPSTAVAEYFHNGGYFRLGGEDYRGVFDAGSGEQRGQQPFVEFTTLDFDAQNPSEWKRRGKQLLAKHWERRPAKNPIRQFQSVVQAQAEALADREPDALHDYAFNTFRLLGSNFAVLGACLDWLSPTPHPLSVHCGLIADTASRMPLFLAKALARRRFDRLGPSLDPAADAWDALFAAVQILAA